ncbi:MAG: tryptophan synthase subunit alpha [Microbacteriaceae bacterium]
MLTLSETIVQAKAARGGAVIGYLPLGFPDLGTSIEAAKVLYSSGFDVVELGIPYSDPVMDGEIIQQATTQALAQGFRLKDVFPAVAAIRAVTDKPIVLMSYWNPILQYGPKAFAAEFKAAGGNGIITPDLIPDEAALWFEAADKHGLDKIFLAAPSSSAARLSLVQNSGSGFVYAVSTMGVTGARAEVDQAAQALVSRIRRSGELPVCVGVGISNATQVQEVLNYADGAIVGTALVRALRDGGIEQLRSLAEELSGKKTA